MVANRLKKAVNVKTYWFLAIFLLILCGSLAFVACGDDDDDDAAPVDDDDDDATDDDDDDNTADDDDITDDDDDDSTPDDDDTTDDDDDTPGVFTCDGDVCTDSASGLMWQNGDACDLKWVQAKNYCANLNWGDFDDWRLPTPSELRSLIRGCAATATGGDCGVTDECLAYMMCWNPPCNGCSFFGGPGPEGRYWPAELSGDGWIYWSFFQVDENSDTAWRVHFYNALVSYNDIEKRYCARCVR